MSYVVVVSTSSVLYTPPNGSENAFAGQTIASATWNATFTDISNNGLVVVGAAATNTIKGNASAAAAVVADLTPAQAQNLLSQGVVIFKASGINFANVSTDNQINVVLPTGYTRYRLDAASLSNASANISAATVALFTAAGGAGVALVTSSTAVTVNTSLENTNNNMQSFTINNVSTQSITAAALFFRTMTATTGTGTVTLFVKPIS